MITFFFKKKRQIVLCFCALIMFLHYSYAQDKLYKNEFPLADVQLLDGPFKHARDLNIQMLLKYDVDRLLAGYRKEAGLPPKAKIYANWDGLDGHVGGHYLSALAMNYAATNNLECKKRLDYMLAELLACQNENTQNHAEWGKGYLGAVPNSVKIWSTLPNGDFAAYRSAWVPYYNIHKTYAGLRDAWLYTGNITAKTIFLQFCDWAINNTAALTDVQMQTLLDTEHGGMNETFVDAYQMTSDKKYLVAAKRFSHNMLLDPMSVGKDNLDNKHANTQVPKAIGFERIAEVTQDDKYAKAGNFFWQTVTTNRTLAFGGNSRREFFNAASAATDFVNDVEGPESCNSYNMLKLTEDLFRANPSANYSDYYERTLYNHILSTQHPEHGGYVYFTPVRPQHYRVYCAPNEGMWCCVGSGMENHGKYNQFIYTHQHDSLFLNLFIASQLSWKEKGVTIKQETNFPYSEQTKLTVTAGNSRFKLLIRYPYWVKEGGLKITVNGKAVTYTAKPASYITVDRLWKKGDVIDVELPMHNTIVQLPNLPDYIAIMHGPILLGAKTGTQDLKGLVAGDSRWGHIAGGRKIPLDKAPTIITDNIASIADKLEPISGKPLTFTASQIKMSTTQNFILEPFYKIHDARYMLYWKALSNSQYRAYQDSIAIVEKENQALQKRTVDFVAPGEQQPEADHFVQKQNSNTGNNQDEFWRDARGDGYFSYSVSTNNETDLCLMIRYWGNERSNRKFDIYIDDVKLISESIGNKWNQQKFQNVEYIIPNELIKDKKNVRVKFQSQQGGNNIIGPIYYIRLLRK
jgi:DUF1680 family protein